MGAEDSRFEGSRTPPGGALDLAAIRGHLPVLARGLAIHVYDRVRSTNDTVAGLLAAEQESFVAALAEHQEGGRGRRGRQWSSPSGYGLLCSVGLTYPEYVSMKAGDWPLLAALAARRAVARFVPGAAIKWPNDLLVQDKKVAGILTELLPPRNGNLRVVVGVGINANTALADLPDEVATRATSLRAASGVVIDRNELAAHLIAQLFDVYESTLRGVRFCDLRDEMLLHCSTIGQFVRVAQGANWLEGVAQTIDSTGALILLSTDGLRHAVVSGEIVETTPSLS